MGGSGTEEDSGSEDTANRAHNARAAQPRTRMRAAGGKVLGGYHIPPPPAGAEPPETALGEFAFGQHKQLERAKILARAADPRRLTPDLQKIDDFKEFSAGCDWSWNPTNKPPTYEDPNLFPNSIPPRTSSEGYEEILSPFLFSPLRENK